MDPVSKDMDIVKAIVKFMAANCGCDFTTDRVTDRLFLCYPSSPQSVTYQAQLHGTFQTPITDLATQLQEWAFSSATIPVQLLPLQLEGACVSSNFSIVECKLTEPTQMEVKTSTSAWSAAAIAGVVVVIVVVIVLIVITLLILIRSVRKRKSKEIPKLKGIFESKRISNSKGMSKMKEIE